jgi:cytochrome bd ubiquinol oxidase subunit II
VTLADTCAALMFVGITLYALFAGADFGAGFWDLLAGSPARGQAPRALIEESIGPVWEANHVWLIFVLVVLWTAFPSAFAPIMSTLYVPLTIAAFGIILRGSGFAFRKTAETLPLQRFYGAVFASSSVLTPYMFGAVVGGVASGRVPPGTSVGNVMTSWINPTSVLGGVMAVVVCAFLAAVYLAADARRRGRDDLVEYFRPRALASGIVGGGVAIAGVFVLHRDAPDLFHGLTHRGAPLIVLSAVAGAATVVLVWSARFALARVSAALAVIAVLWGWAAAQYPYMLERSLRVQDAAGAHDTLVAVLGVVAVGSVLLAPALVLLFVMTQRGVLVADH